MEVEYTGRQVAVTKELRGLADTALDRIAKVLGKTSSAHVVLTTEKNRQIAEVTIKARLQNIVSLCESTNMETALRQALDKSETQALRSKEKVTTRKRLPKSDRATVEPGLERPKGASRATPDVLGSVMASADRPLAESFPKIVPQPAKTNGNGNGAKPPSSATQALTSEPHVVRSLDSVSLRPMSLEEAVKEAEFRDRDVFVFRDPSGQIKVLHCRRDGIMELIELPELLERA